jgi:hypothetical protein
MIRNRSHKKRRVEKLSYYFLPWRWRRYVPPKRRFTQDLHGATSQKTAFFIVAAVKTSNLTNSLIVASVFVAARTFLPSRSLAIYTYKHWRAIYEARRWDGLIWNDTHTKFHKGWLRHSDIDKGDKQAHREEGERKKNQLKDNGRTFSYTTDPDYVILSTKSLLLCRPFLVHEYRTKIKSIWPEIRFRQKRHFGIETLLTYRYFNVDITYKVSFRKMISINYWNLIRIVTNILRFGPSEGGPFLDLECLDSSSTDLWRIHFWIPNTNKTPPNVQTKSIHPAIRYIYIYRWHRKQLSHIQGHSKHVHRQGIDIDFSSSTFQRNTLPPASGSRSKSSKKLSRRKLQLKVPCYCLGFHFYPEDGGSTSIRNVSGPEHTILEPGR